MKDKPILEKSEPELNSSSVYGDTSSVNHNSKPMLEASMITVGATNVSVCHESDTTLLMNATENGSPFKANTNSISAHESVIKRPSQRNSAVKVF